MYRKPTTKNTQIQKTNKQLTKENDHTNRPEFDSLIPFIPKMEILYQWFDSHKRNLPWRMNRTPYRVLVSEIMLQQTRVTTVIPFYLKWMSQFPTLKTLADADIQTVYKAWEGLGYYRRARMLYECAKIVHSDEQFPFQIHELIRLPGIGLYTAHALAVFAFGIPYPILDGNISRVISRWFLLNLRFSNSRDQKLLRDIFQQVILIWKNKAEEISLFQQDELQKQLCTVIESVMELGATVCIPKKPRCCECPVSLTCRAFQHQSQAQYPPTLKKQKIPTVKVAVGILEKNQKVLFGLRKQSDFLGGLWELPGGKVNENERPEEAIVREFFEETGLQVEVIKSFAPVKHAFTHFKILMYPFQVKRLNGKLKANSAEKLKFIPIHQLSNFPFPKATKLVLQHNGYHLEHHEDKNV